VLPLTECCQWHHFHIYSSRQWLGVSGHPFLPVLFGYMDWQPSMNRLWLPTGRLHGRTLGCDGSCESASSGQERIRIVDDYTLCGSRFAGLNSFLLSTWVCFCILAHSFMSLIMIPFSVMKPEIVRKRMNKDEHTSSKKPSHGLRFGSEVRTVITTICPGHLCAVPDSTDLWDAKDIWDIWRLWMSYCLTQIKSKTNYWMENMSVVRVSPA